ncbi:hypothetical protein HMJ29_06125 [Hymenobacter taeanensis]|uniref:Uncharacterized protein n=1 Tax=Hymenobacter taeanensis TaxID=2735321 RepID=A0A6M6BE77_9BACT|nr:hypothetical protein [Hymenobacter taeanensis]QJX46536.1 hypothetical protein HMJ29_06125 [Hymenobacter taeanensis]
MRQADLPEQWKIKLRDYLTAKGSSSEMLGTTDFPTDSVVRILFEDDSKVEFKYAFAIEAPELKEVAVFTEHCGHHLFQLYDGINLVMEKR